MGLPTTFAQDYHCMRQVSVSTSDSCKATELCGSRLSGTAGLYRAAHPDGYLNDEIRSLRATELRQDVPDDVNESSFVDKSMKVLLKSGHLASKCFKMP